MFPIKQRADSISSTSSSYTVVTFHPEVFEQGIQILLMYYYFIMKFDNDSILLIIAEKLQLI